MMNGYDKPRVHARTCAPHCACAQRRHRMLQRPVRTASHDARAAGAACAACWSAFHSARLCSFITGEGLLAQVRSEGVREEMESDVPSAAWAAELLRARLAAVAAAPGRGAAGTDARGAHGSEGGRGEERNAVTGDTRACSARACAWVGMVLPVSCDGGGGGGHAAGGQEERHRRGARGRRVLSELLFPVVGVPG